MPKPLSYWQKYDLLHKKYSKKQQFRKLKDVCIRHGVPYERSDPRGRKLKFSVFEYCAFLCVQKTYGHKYREMELEADLYLSDKADHATFQRNFEKISEEYLESVIISFVDREFDFWIADSTGISTKISDERLIGGQRRKELLTDKYHVIIGYDPPTNTTMILGVKATDNHISDSQGAIMLLGEKKSHAYFLGDSAYNTYALHEKVQQVGLFPLMKPDNKGIRKTLSVKARQVRLFVKPIYKEVRGIVETVFGGATNAGLMITHARKEHTRRLDTLMLALRHNLRTSLRLLKQIFYATNSVMQQVFYFFQFSKHTLQPFFTLLSCSMCSLHTSFEPISVFDSR
jgi:hypothetical protein